MKIGYKGLSLPEGKIKYNDEILLALETKFDPKKVTPYFFEFIPGEFDKCDAIAISSDNILDLLILDMEKLETRLERGATGEERVLIERCLEALEIETPLCDLDFTEAEAPLIRNLAPLSYKAVKIYNDPNPDPNDVCTDILKKSGHMFFYTAGKPEVHAWFVEKGSDAVTCAGKIHSDLARGFIKAEVVNFEKFKDCHNFNDAKKQGLVDLVDKDHEINHGDIIEIRFNV